MNDEDQRARLVRGPQDTTALVGDRVLLKATYVGHPEPTVRWTKAGKELKNDERTSITSGEGVSCLLLQNITTDDSGVYDVTVKNGGGADCHYASVSVEGPPDPPSGTPTITAFNDSVMVAWSSSPYDGGKKVLGYAVEYSMVGSDIWTTAVDDCTYLSHPVVGLQPGGRYVFRVKAYNVHGYSRSSLESDIVQLEEHNEQSSFEPRLVTVEPGVDFKSRFDVQEELGKGRFGVVHKVVDKTTNQKLAAKFIRCRTPKDKDKVLEEIAIMNLLRHQKLLQLAAAFENLKEMVMVMEYISGGELFERVVADDFTLTEKDCILFMRQICEGVAYMHSQNVVHLDLKPENIMCHTRTSHEIKIIDFGLAQKINPDVPVRVLFGTPEFIPPEIINYEPIGVESDMWSLGVICYVLLSGLSPFMGDSDSETFANITRADYDFDDEAFDAISQDARDFISALLVKRKEDRLTAEQCLRHVWLDPDNHQTTVILSTDKLKKFIIRRKWQKTGNAIRALGRMTKMSDSRRNSANSSNPATPRPSISGTLVPRMGSLEEEKLITKIQTSLLTGSFDENDEVTSEQQHKDVVLKQLPKETGRSKKEVRTRACSERSDSGISDCSTHTHVTSSSCNSTPLLGKKFPINEEGETYISSVSINLTSNHLRASSEESDSSPKQNGNLTRLSDKIQSFQSPNKSKPSPQPSESLKRLPNYVSRSVQDTIKKFDKKLQDTPTPIITVQRSSSGAGRTIDRLVQRLETATPPLDTATPTVRYRSPSPSLLRKTQAVLNKEACTKDRFTPTKNGDGRPPKSPAVRRRGNHEGFQKAAAFWNGSKT